VTQKRDFLDRSSPCPPFLARLLAQKLTALELLPGMSAARIGSETARLKSVSTAPTGEGYMRTPESWRLEWEECETNRQRLSILRKLDRIVQEGKGVSELADRRGTREWKLRIARDTRTSALVAIDHGISPSRVRQLRMDLISGKLC
jgi:hypothetical protein